MSSTKKRANKTGIFEQIVNNVDTDSESEHSASTGSSDSDTDEEIVISLNITKKALDKANNRTVDKPVDKPVKKKRPPAKFIVDDIESNNDSDDDDNTSNSTINTLKQKITKQEKMIAKLEAQLKMYVEKFDELDGHNTTDDVYRLHHDLLRDASDGKTIRPCKTTSLCWWCRDKFDNPPSFIPYSCSDGCYNVQGVCCSDNCAVAYITASDNRVEERISLVIEIHNLIYPDDQINSVVAAPPIETRKEYGGTLTLKQFRNVSKLNRSTYSLLMPPMKPIKPFIEREQVSNELFKHTFAKEGEKTMTHFRTKPLPRTQNTLEKSFGIKFNN